MSKQHDKVSQLMTSKVDFRKLGKPGDYSTLHEKLARDLAREIQRAKDPDYVSISWAAQCEAQDYFNEHGFECTLDRLVKLEAANDAKATGGDHE